ncbi:lysophospholipid acyltransferase family protein [Colwellia sp. RE-S-Sl-9]
MKKINKYWRIFATGSAFTLFGFGGILLTLIVFPIVNFIHRHNEYQRKYSARKVVHKTFKMFVNYMSFVGILTLEIENEEQLKQHKGKLVIANHPSLIDVVVLISIIENADCVVKAGLWKNPFLKGVVTNTGYINNEEDPDTFLKDCSKTFEEGNNLIVFPEGTRSSIDKPLKFKRGAANIALRTKVDIVPIILTVTPTTLTKELAWYQIPDKKFTVKLVVNPVLSTQKYREAESVSNSVRELTRDLVEYYKEEFAAHE